MPRTPTGPRWLKIRVRSLPDPEPDPAARPTEYDIDQHGKLTIRPERQQRRANLYVDTLGPSAVGQAPRTARCTFQTSPQPLLPGFSGPYPLAHFSPSAMLFSQFAMPAVPRPPPPQVTPTPQEFTEDPLIDPFWTDSLPGTEWIPSLHPDSDFFGE
jgi:hypothetical protein